MNNLTSIMPHLTRLRELVDIARNNHVKYQVKSGSCEGWGLLSEEDVGVQQAVVIAGTEFHEHAHSEFECLIVYRGELQMRIDGKDTSVTAPGAVCIPYNTPHSWFAPVDTCIIATIIPNVAGEYPHAGTR